MFFDQLQFLELLRNITHGLQMSQMSQNLFPRLYILLKYCINSKCRYYDLLHVA